MVPWDPETGFCQAGKAGENFLQPFKEMDHFYAKKRQFWFFCNLCTNSEDSIGGSYDTNLLVTLPKSCHWWYLIQKIYFYLVVSAIVVPNWGISKMADEPWNFNKFSTFLNIDILYTIGKQILCWIWIQWYFPLYLRCMRVNQWYYRGRNGQK